MKGVTCFLCIATTVDPFPLSLAAKVYIRVIIFQASVDFHSLYLSFLIELCIIY